MLQHDAVITKLLGTDTERSTTTLFIATTDDVIHINSGKMHARSMSINALDRLYEITQHARNNIRAHYIHRDSTATGMGAPVYSLGNFTSAAEAYAIAMTQEDRMDSQLPSTLTFLRHYARVASTARQIRALRAALKHA